MIPTEICITVRSLAAQGHSLREISRLLALSRNTVRRILFRDSSDGRSATRSDGRLTNPLIPARPGYRRDSTRPRRYSSRSWVGAARWLFRIGGG